MGTFNIIVGIIVAFSVISVILVSFEGTDVDWWDVFKKVLLFIPIIIIGTILYVAGDFKNHRLGYIVIFIVISFVGFGFYMGYQAGPSSPAPWN